MIDNAELRFKLRAIDTALAELKKHRVLYAVAKERINDPHDRRKTIDAIYQLMPTHEFAQQVIMGNKRIRILQDKAVESGKVETLIINHTAALEIGN